MEISLIGSIIVWILSELATVSSFEVFWNIPSFMCKKHLVEFSDIVPTYGIQQNDDDKFQGEKITILYDPGFFPALSTKKDMRNGGVPQEGNVTKHLEIYRQTVDELVPDRNHSGLIIIDFESWRPIFRQNWGVLSAYKDVSYQIERQRHPFWQKQRQQAEAERRFEISGRKFVEETIKLSKLLRPHAQWGYYAFPYCFNKGINADCPREVKNENDRIGWMFFHSDMILPSIYLYENMEPEERQSMAKGRIKEAVRASRAYSDKPMPIYVYIRYVYPDSRNLLSESDLLMAFQQARAQGTNGMILWGSSYDLSSRKACERLMQYLEDTLGPISQSFASKRFFVDTVRENGF